MQRILIVDNDDSFVYNIVEMLRPLVDIDVVRHSHLQNCAGYDKILLSPGAGRPKQYPRMMQLLERYSATHPILGVCLGHQAIAEHFGAKLVQLPKPFHGHQSTLSHPVFGVEKAGRYHSWAVDEEGIPDELRILSTDRKDGCIMAIKHCILPIYGVQFHPESIITDYGKIFFEHWIQQ